MDGFSAAGYRAGDEVIVCANAYIACVMGITINGASPVFVEPDEYDNIDAGRIEAAVTPATKAILAVHLFGQTCDMDAICQIPSVNTGFGWWRTVHKATAHCFTGNNPARLAISAASASIPPRVWALSVTGDAS